MKKMRNNLIALTLFCCGSLPGCIASETAESPGEAVSRVEVRGVYGGIPGEEKDGASLSDFGVTAVFLNSRSITAETVEAVHSQGAGIFAEFNTLHQAEYLEAHPDAAPVGRDGKVSPPASGWQGICPTHPGYRMERMQEFRQLLNSFSLDGVWLDYHQAHANWELAEPVMPDTCFCDRCLGRFSADTGIELPQGSTGDISSYILDEHGDEWISWRNGIYTDWIREFREILDEESPQTLLGYYHCPWTDKEFDGALVKKLAIDLKSQAEYIDVFSPLLYHAYLGHAGDLGWISSHVAWLGDYLGVEGKPGEKVRIWPIVQLADLGGDVPASEVAGVLDAGLRHPSSGVMFFSWGRIKDQPGKVQEMARFYLAAE